MGLTGVVTLTSTPSIGLPFVSRTVAKAASTGSLGLTPCHFIQTLMEPTMGGLPTPLGTENTRSARSPEARIRTSLVTALAAELRLVSLALKFAASVGKRARE